MVRTKIIATLGPSSHIEATIKKMILKGLDMVRLNFSHGTHTEHVHRINTIRKLNKKMRRSIKIMQDLEGYRIRVGDLKHPFELKKNSKLYLTQDKVLGNEKEVSFDYEGSLTPIKIGTYIYIDDGKIVLQVKSKDKKRLKVKVIIGGTLHDNKGINIPAAKLEFEGLTAKDKKDVKVGIKHNVDCISQSFVRSVADLNALKNIVKPKNPHIHIFAKIESREALPNLSEIIEAADGVMVARGDLGICVPIYKVPVIQKEIVKQCRIKNKPVIVATQMLDSMTENNLPTRAEVCDVANAILDGATHLLLSAETAVGKHPPKVIDMMNKIIKNTETYERRLSELLT